MAYTGPECPINRREADGGSVSGPLGRAEPKGLPSRFQTRIYDSEVPAATSSLS